MVASSVTSSQDQVVPQHSQLQILYGIQISPNCLVNDSVLLIGM